MPRQKIEYISPDGEKFNVLVDVPAGESQEATLKTLDTHWMQNQAPGVSKPAIPGLTDDQPIPTSHAPTYSSGAKLNFAPGDSMSLDEGESFLSLPKDQQQATLKHVLSGSAAGMIPAGPMMSALNAATTQTPADLATAGLTGGAASLLGKANVGNRGVNAFLGMLKGYGLHEMGNQTHAAISGSPPPSLNPTDPSQLIPRLASMGLGGFGANPAEPTSIPEQDARLLWQAKKRQMDAEIEKAGAVKPQIKRGLDEAKAAFEKNQKSLGINKASVGADSAESIADQILKEQANLDQLKTKASTGFDPDPEVVSTLQSNLKKYQEQAANNKGIVRTNALNRLREHQAELDRLQGESSAASEDHQQKILDSMKAIREMRVNQRRMNQGRFEEIPSNADIANGQKGLDLKKAYEQAQDAFKQHEDKLTAIKTAHADHVLNEPPPDKEADQMWQKLAKMAGKGGLTGTVAHQALLHIGVPPAVAADLSIALGMGVNSPQAKAAISFIKKKAGTDASKAIGPVVNVENSIQDALK